MKKIILSLIAITLSITVLNITNASYCGNENITITKNGGTYEICDGNIIINVPSGAVNQPTTLTAKEVNYIPNNGGYFEIVGYIIDFKLGNNINFEKGIKISTNIDKNNQSIVDNLGLILGGDKDEFTFYKNYHKVLVEGSETNNEKYTLSKSNNFILDRNNNKVNLSNIININGSFTLASFLPKDIETFTSLSYSEQTDIKNKLNKIKELIIDRKEEILGYMNKLGINAYPFYYDNKKYELFKSRYSFNKYIYGSPETKKELDLFYNELLGKYDGIYNKLKIDASKIQDKSSNNNTSNNTSSSTLKSNEYYEYKSTNGINPSTLKWRYETDKNSIDFSINASYDYLNHLNNIYDEINKLNIKDNKGLEIKNDFVNLINKYQGKINHFNDVCNMFKIHDNLYMKGYLTEVGTYIDNNNCYHISDVFENIETNEGYRLEDKYNDYLDEYYEENEDYEENNYEEQKETVNAYKLTTKQKIAINKVGNKINSMSLAKRNKYKILLDKYSIKFEEGSLKHEIIKQLIEIIKSRL